jgi:hypothetical protein
MVNPLLTILFDIFLIGSALVVTGGMVAEYLATREPHVGRVGRSACASNRRQNSSPRATVHRIGSERRRAA